MSPNSGDNALVNVTPEQVLRYRLRAMHLHERTTSYADAAWGGLQDSAPKAGQLSLFARAEGVGPEAWEDPSLVQIWFRGADYIVPRDDVAVFTLGRLPRDAAQHGTYEELCDEVHDICGGQACIARDVYAKLRDASHEKSMLVRWASVTGRLHIRWDASKIWIIPAEAPDADPEDCRLELARRFLGWLGPADVGRFAWWAGIEPRDANETWKLLGRELTSVNDNYEILGADADALAGSMAVQGVRLVPFNDPYLKVDQDLLVGDAARRDGLFPPQGKSVGFLPGALLVDGKIVGRWQRQQGKVTIEPWRKLGKRVVDAATAEAEGVAAAVGRRSVIAWK